MGGEEEEEDEAILHAQLVHIDTRVGFRVGQSDDYLESREDDHSVPHHVCHIPEHRIGKGLSGTIPEAQLNERQEVGE